MSAQHGAADPELLRAAVLVLRHGLQDGDLTLSLAGTVLLSWLIDRSLDRRLMDELIGSMQVPAVLRGVLDYLFARQAPTHPPPSAGSGSATLKNLVAETVRQVRQDGAVILEVIPNELELVVLTHRIGRRYKSRLAGFPQVEGSGHTESESTAALLEALTAECRKRQAREAPAVGFYRRMLRLGCFWKC